MKIVKLQNGNVQLLSDSGELIKSLSPAATLQIAQEGAAVRVNYGKNNIHDIYPSEVTSTEIQPAAAVPFTGGVPELLSLLSESFFFDEVSGGGGGALYNISSTQWQKLGTAPQTLSDGQVANGFTFFSDATDRVTEGITTYDQYFIAFGIDLTFTGTSGTANVNVDGVDYLATFNGTLAQTAQDFVATHAAALLAANVNLLYNGGSPINPNGDETIRFCASEASCNSVTITTLTGDLNGTRINPFTGVNAAASDHVLIPYVGRPYEGQRIHHTFRVNFGIATGSQQTLALSLRRFANDTVIGSEIQIFRTPDEEGQQYVFETYTSGANDPYVTGGFYFALRNDSGVSVDIQGDVGILLQQTFQSPNTFP